MYIGPLVKVSEDVLGSRPRGGDLRRSSGSRDGRLGIPCQGGPNTLTSPGDICKPAVGLFQIDVSSHRYTGRRQGVMNIGSGYGRG